MSAPARREKNAARPTGLVAPDMAVPGQASACKLELVYDGDGNAADPRLRIAISPTGAIANVTVNGRAASVTGSGRCVVIALEPMSSGHRASVGFDVTLPLGTPNGTAFSLDAMLRAGSTTVSHNAVVRARSSAHLSRDRSSVALTGDAALVIDKPRTLQLAICNDGTCSAQDVAVAVTESQDVTCSGSLQLGDIAASDTRIAYLGIVATGPDPKLTFSLTHQDSEAAATELAFVGKALRGPVLRGTLERDGELPVTEGSTQMPVRIELDNAGDCVATTPIVTFDLPAGVRILGTQGAAVQFEPLAAGATSSRSVVLEIDDARASFAIGATVDGGVISSDASRLLVEPERCVAVRIVDFSVGGELTAGEPELVHLVLSYEGNDTARESRLTIAHGDPLAFDGHFTINGAAVDLALDGPVVLSDVASGTLVSLQWSVRADRGTPRGTTTVITAALDVDGTAITASTTALSVKPSVRAARSADELPFRVSGSAAAGTTREAAPATPTAPVSPKPAVPERELPPAAEVKTPDPTPAPKSPPKAQAQIEPKVEQPKLAATIDEAGAGNQDGAVKASPENEADEEDDAIAPPISPPNSDSLRALRARLSVAASASSPLQTIVFGLGALADAGTHPSTSEYRKAVTALRRAMAEGTRGLTVGITRKLGKDLAPFATLIPGEHVGLLGGLAAVADAIASSANVDAPYWNEVRSYGREIGDMLRSAAAEAVPDLEDDPNADHRALVNARHENTRLTLLVPQP